MEQNTSAQHIRIPGRSTDLCFCNLWIGPWRGLLSMGCGGETGSGRGGRSRESSGNVALGQCDLSGRGGRRFDHM